MKHILTSLIMPCLCCQCVLTAGIEIITDEKGVSNFVEQILLIILRFVAFRHRDA